MVLTVNAYEAFEATPIVSEALMTLKKAVQDLAGQTDLSGLKAASKACVEALHQVLLPASMGKLVSS